MIRLAIISDTQYGSRNDFIPYLENNKKFFENVFYPTLHKEKVTTIVHLGDLVERRKYISYRTANYLLRDFFGPINDRMDFHWILGNHDLFFRETTEINAGKFFSFGTSYSTATEVEFDGVPILFVPWIVNENREQTLEVIKNSKAQILFGHLELKNFETSRGIVSRDGMDSSLLDKFDIVLAGHFHHRSAKGNIYYVGSHAEFTWADAGEERGFHIFDTETRGIKFFPNPYTVFAKIYYDDSQGKPAIPHGGFAALKDKIVKVVVSSKTDTSQYDWFMSQVEDSQPLDVTPVDDHLNLNLTDDENIVSETKDTLGIIRDYVKQATGIVNVEKLDSLVVNLYQKAQSET